MLAQRLIAGVRSVVTTGVLILFCLPIYLVFHQRNPDWSGRSSTWLSTLGQNEIGTASPALSPNTTSEPPASQPTLNVDAHKLETADSFLPHFKAVTQLDGLAMADVKSTCWWENSEDVNFQWGPPTKWVVQDRDDEELAFRRHQWQRFINDELLPYESYKDKFEGRGIVILAGNGKSLKRVKVILRQLKRFGSQLPMEIHFWGDEFPLPAQKEMALLWPRMYFNDLSKPSNILKSSNDNFFHVNYQLKTAAVLNARFAEVLLLDSDNIPTIDPESLFESETYKEYGTIFWPDIARTQPNNPMWAITNTKCRRNEYEQESGQMIVDKRKFFYHLQLAAWFNNSHANYYMEFLLGDKDLFRFAWHALKTKYGSPRKWLTSVGSIAPDGSYCGHTFAQHHPNGSVAFLHGGLLKTIPKQIMKWQRENKDGIFQAYKRSVVDEQHDLIEKVTIKMDGGDTSYLTDRPENMRTQWCTEMVDVHARKLDEIVPGFQKIFEAIGGYWMLDDDEDYNPRS